MRLCVLCGDEIAATHDLCGDCEFSQRESFAFDAEYDRWLKGLILGREETPPDVEDEPHDGPDVFTPAVNGFTTSWAHDPLASIATTAEEREAELYRVATEEVGSRAHAIPTFRRPPTMVMNSEAGRLTELRPSPWVAVHGSRVPRVQDGAEPRPGWTWAVESPGQGRSRLGAGPLQGANSGNVVRPGSGQEYVLATVSPCRVGAPLAGGTPPG
jgi:hypothetical protein